MSIGRIITVFGSSGPREGDAEYAEAQALRCALAERGFAVCTGGYGGVMDAVCVAMVEELGAAPKKK